MNKKITFVLVLALAAFLVMGSASAGLFDFLGGGDDTVKIGYLPYSLLMLKVYMLKKILLLNSFNSTMVET